MSDPAGMCVSLRTRRSRLISAPYCASEVAVPRTPDAPQLMTPARSDTAAVGVDVAGAGRLGGKWRRCCCARCGCRCCGGVGLFVDADGGREGRLCWGLESGAGDELLLLLWLDGLEDGDDEK